jgi:hypothetical protein
MRKLTATSAALLLLACAGQAAAAAGDLAAQAPCTTVVSTVDDAQVAVTGGQAGHVVCLADGAYDALELVATAPAPGVTLRAENPGRAFVAGAKMAGGHVTLAQVRLTGEVSILPGSVGMTIAHNLIVGRGKRGGYGVMVCPATPPQHCDDVSIVGNRFEGSFNEDAIRANLYHDGADADRNGLLVEGNEFVGNREYGGHNDVFQSVWGGDHLVFRRNYVHDFGGQGFFVKDQHTAIDGLVVENNLIVKQDLPCLPASLCQTWQLSPFQVYGPAKNVSIRHNTVWPGAKGGELWLRGTGWGGPIVFSGNVLGRVSSDAQGLTTAYRSFNNTRCEGIGLPPAGLATDCSPAFLDASQGDYRLADGRGVDWALAGARFGPLVPRDLPANPAAPDGDDDGIPDASDLCATLSSRGPDGCPMPDEAVALFADVMAVNRQIAYLAG